MFIMFIHYDCKIRIQLDSSLHRCFPPDQVYAAVILCCVSTLLCAITAVLSGTHVVHPLLHLSKCVYVRAQRMCRCATRFERDGLRLEEVSKGGKSCLAFNAH